jgi:hypothetical protein
MGCLPFKECLNSPAYSVYPACISDKRLAVAEPALQVCS